MTHRELFRAEQLPALQNRTYPTSGEARACARGDVVLVQHAATGLVFNAAFDPKRVVYDESYQNEQACSEVFRQHLDAVADVVARHFGQAPLIEIGCGKGYFLDLLSRRGHRITGIDPAYEGSDPRIIAARFEPGLCPPAGGIILRQVLEHIQEPVEFLAEVARANGAKGRIYIEVPCFEWICERRAWFDIFYEHVNYFTLGDFHRMFGSVLEAGRLFGGQYLYVVAELASLRPPRGEAAHGVPFPADFLSGIRRIGRYAEGGRKLGVWGGASKGVIFALYAERLSRPVDAIVDINPRKQGTYVAGTGLRIASPDEASCVLPEGSAMMVMNSNYLDEIAALSRNRYQYIPVDSVGI